MEFLKRYKFSIIWAVIMLIGCTIKLNGEHEPLFDIPHKDKIVHFGIFGILGFLNIWESRNFQYKSLIIIALYGVLIELIQLFLPWRSFEWLDILADSLGAWAGMLIGKYLLVNKLK